LFISRVGRPESIAEGGCERVEYFVTATARAYTARTAYYDAAALIVDGQAVQEGGCGRETGRQ
jgi:hypothetical protein